MNCGENTARSNARLTRFAVKALVLCLFAAALTAPAYANASVFVNTGVASCGVYGACQAASTFGMLIGPSDAVTMTGTTTILNDIGVKSGATLTTTGTINVGSSTNSSIVDFADTLTGAPAVPCTGSGCFPPSGSSFSTGTKVWGGTASNATLVNNAYTQFTDLSTYWNTHTGISSLGAPTMSGTWNIGTGGGVHLYTATGNLTQSNDLTITCGAGACDPTALIVILVPSSFTVNLTRNINFAAGSNLTDDQLLFLINATGTGSGSGAALQIGPGAKNTTRTLHGDFFLPNGNFTLGSTNNGSHVDFFGRVFANATAVAANVDTINQGTTIEFEDTVPEPSTWAAMIGGLGALIYLHRRRRKAQAAE